MAQTVSVPLNVQPGVFSEETARQAGNYFRDGSFVRFKNGLPEKMGGWTLASNGTTEGLVYGVPDDGLKFGYFLTTATYGAGVTSIPNIDLPGFTAADGDAVWLFGDSKTGGIGTLTVSDATAVAGAFVADASGVLTAAVGDAVFIDYGEEFAGAGAAITSGTAAGSRIITLGTGVTTFLEAGSLVVIPLQSAQDFITTLRYTVLSGATTIELLKPLPFPALTISPVAYIYSPETSIRNLGDYSIGVVIKFLANAPAASVELIFTTALPHNADGKDIDVRPFQATTANGVHAAAATLTINDITDFAITTVATWPDGTVMRADLFPDQVAYKGVCRATHDWTDLNSQELMAFGTECKLYLVISGVLFDITPIRTTGTLTDPFDTSQSGLFDPTGGTDARYVRVRHVGHNLSTGNYVRFTGPIVGGGVTIDGEYRVEGIDATQFYIIKASHPATSTLVAFGGSVPYEYDVDCGVEISVTAMGWGTGDFGEGAWGVGDGLYGIEVPARVWSLDNFGEDLLASPNNGPLYYWDRTLGENTRAVLVDTAPASIQRMLVSPQARHVIAVGADTGTAISPGDPDPLLIRWSDQESISDFASTATNAGGDIRLDVGSRAIAAVESRGDILIFTDESLHALLYVGTPLFFTLRHLGQSVSIVGPNGAVDVNGIVYFMSLDDFLVYDGVIRVLESPINATVFGDLNRDQGAQIYLGVNKLFTEIMYFYPSLGSTVVDRYAKYNYTENTWDYGVLSRTAWADSSSFYGKLPYGFNGGVIYIHENNVDGQDENGVLLPIISYLETYDMEADAGFNMLHISRMVPDFKILTQSIDLLLLGRTYPQGPQKTKGPFTITSSTRKTDVRMRSKQMAYRVTSSNAGDFWRMSQWRAEGVLHGRRGGQ